MCVSVVRVKRQPHARSLREAYRTCMVDAAAERRIRCDVGREPERRIDIAVERVPRRNGGRAGGYGSRHVRGAEVFGQCSQPGVETAFSIAPILHWQRNPTCSQVAYFYARIAVNLMLNAQRPGENLRHYRIIYKARC